MPAKRDETGRRWVQMETLLPGPREAVWRAMATGEGNAAWFAKATIEPQIGGLFALDFGPMGGSTGQVTAWEPPHYFAYVERDWDKGAPPCHTEITLAERPGGQVLMRMVHYLFSDTDTWDASLEQFESGWTGFFEVLRAYLTHFAGQPAASFMAMQMTKGDLGEVWTRLTEALGVAGANVGEVRSAASTPQPLSGVVERMIQDDKLRAMLLQIEAPSPGIAMVGAFAMGEMANASLSVFFYGDDAEARAAASHPLWQAWMGEAFPAPA